MFSDVGLDTHRIQCLRGKVLQAAKKLAIRKGPIGETVNILSNAKAHTTSPEVVCKDCNKAFLDGVTRIKEEKERGLKSERKEVDAGAELDPAEELAALVFVSQHYRKKLADDDPDALESEGGVNDILLDEAGFWSPLLAALQDMVPITKVLRMCDGNKPVIMGEMYDRMLAMAQKVSQVSEPFAAEAARLIEERWEYLHSFMHGAAYAFDPNFFDNRNNWDEATTNGVMDLIERITARDMIQESPDPVKARRELTFYSQAVVERVAAAEVEVSQFCKGLGPFSKKKVRINAKVLEPS
ncbi:MAG: hypothetical protein SGPRY_003542 [Prymnesium sp.]